MTSGAPAVNYPSGRSRKAQRVLWTLWAIGTSGVVAACWRAEAIGWRSALMVVSALAAAGALRRDALRNKTPLELKFDGMSWSMAGTAATRGAEARVVLDFQSFLLVQLVGPQRAACWTWLEEESHPPRWQDLRRALYARAPLAGPTDGSAHRSPVDAHRPAP